MHHTSSSERPAAAVLQALLTLTAVGCALACADAQAPARPRAIVLISLDTLRADYLNLYGYRRYETSPSLDDFARDAVVFDPCVVSETHTLPSHMSLFTGLHPQRHGVDPTSALAEGIPTLTQVLRDHGYATAGFADGGYLIRRFGFDRGFDRYEAQHKRGLPRILDEARRWLRVHGAFPFFLFLHSYDVHSDGAWPLYRSPPPFGGMFSGGMESPLADPSSSFRAAFEERKDRLTEADLEYLRATYAEGVRYVDDQLGRFFQHLREKGLYEDALIAVWSDHGEALGERGDFLHDTLFAHTHRCALLMKVPGIPGGRRVERVASGVDLAPTLLELAGAPVPGGLDGRSLVPALLGEEDGDGEPVRLAFTRRTRQGKRLFSVRSARHQLLWDARRDHWELYDLASDPEQRHNLSPSGSGEEKRLRRRLRAWVAAHDAAVAQRRAGPAPGLDEEEEQQLRELGYLE